MRSVQVGSLSDGACDFEPHCLARLVIGIFTPCGRQAIHQPQPPPADAVIGWLADDGGARVRAVVGHLDPYDPVAGLQAYGDLPVWGASRARVDDRVRDDLAKNS